jgi:hypothetical protein
VVRVVIGPAIEAAGRDPRELNAEVQDWIESRMRALSGAHPGAKTVQSKL